MYSADRSEGSERVDAKKTILAEEIVECKCPKR